MADALAGHYGPDKRILEPSAGLGRLYRATRAAGHAGPMVLVDISPDCCRELYGVIDGDNATLRQGDFLTMDLGRFDGAIMNPPFKQGRDIRHIRHALAMLNPGGRLVALCYNGPRQREQLRPLATSWVELEPGSFRSEGTGAAVVLAIFDK
jgi:16S rRNA G1207 methylase RsmC